MTTQRYGFVVALKPDKIDEYERVHQNVWPEVEQRFRDVGVHELVLFRQQNLVFMFMRYEGDEDLETLLKRYADDPKIQEWEQLNAEFKEPAADSTPNGFVALKPFYVLSTDK